jgi:hypothetical protein
MNSPEVAFSEDIHRTSKATGATSAGMTTTQVIVPALVFDMVFARPHRLVAAGGAQYFHQGTGAG